MSKKFVVEIEGGSRIDLEWDGSKQVTASTIGGLSLLERVRTVCSDLTNQGVGALQTPTGQSTEDLLVKQLVQRLKGDWPEEPQDPELCHCRKVSQAQVERAVILGAHTIEKVRLLSSANTGCGTCLTDVQDVIDLYLAT